MKKIEEHKSKISKLHRDKLGMDIPEGFFEKSKEDILSKTIKENKSKPRLVWLRPMIAYPIAATLVIALAVTFWLKNASPEINNRITDTENVKQISDFYEDEFLISSLLVLDSDVDEFLDTYIMDEILVEVDKSEQEIDDLIINSLFIGDSLIDSYIEQNLIENVVL